MVGRKDGDSEAWVSVWGSVDEEEVEEEGESYGHD